MSEYKVKVNGNIWHTNSPQSEYDAIHTVAGAILAGAENVDIERVDA